MVPGAHDGVGVTVWDLQGDKAIINHQQGQEQDAPGSDASIPEQTGCEQTPEASLIPSFSTKAFVSLNST